MKTITIVNCADPRVGYYDGDRNHGIVQWVLNDGGGSQIWVGTMIESTTVTVTVPDGGSVAVAGTGYYSLYTDDLLEQGSRIFVNELGLAYVGLPISTASPLLEGNMIYGFGMGVALGMAILGARVLGKATPR